MDTVEAQLRNEDNNNLITEGTATFNYIPSLNGLEKAVMKISVTVSDFRPDLHNINCILWINANEHGRVNLVLDKFHINSKKTQFHAESIGIFPHEMS